MTDQRPAVRRLLAAKPPRGFTPFLATPDGEPELLEFSASIFGGHALEQPLLRHGLRRGHFLYFGVRKGNTIAAACAIEFNARQRRAYLVEYGVRKAFRGHGLGQWILHTAETLARHADCRTLTSHAEPDNKASLALQESAGLTRAKLIRRYHPDGRDSFYMTKFL